MATNQVDMQQDMRREQLRQCLNRDQVKLWLPPYTQLENPETGHYPEELTAKYSSELNLSASVISSLLESLRLHALDKLAAKKKFTETGLASIKLKIAGTTQVLYDNVVTQCWYLIIFFIPTGD